MPKAGHFTRQQVHMQENLSVWIEKAAQMDIVPLHSHDFVEIAFVATGSAFHIHTDKTGHTRTGGLIQGDLFSIQRGEKHAYEHCGSMVLYNIFLKPGALKNYQHLNILPGWELLFGDRDNNSEICLHLPASVRNFGVQCLDNAVRECLYMRPGYEFIIPALVMQFLITAMRSGETNRKLLDNVNSDILKTISDIENASESHFTLKELAATAGMSVSSYTKKFRESTGLSPLEYILQVRFQQVCYYLAASNLSIGEIAAKCGFCTPNYLIKLFRRQFGMTPLLYRKNQRQ